MAWAPAALVPAGARVAMRSLSVTAGVAGLDEEGGAPGRSAAGWGRKVVRNFLKTDGVIRHFGR